MLIDAIKTLLIFGFVVHGLSRLVVWVARKQNLESKRREGHERADLARISSFALVDEGTSTTSADRAQAVALLPLLLVFAVIPFGGVYVLGDVSVDLVIADLDAGIFFVVALLLLAMFSPIAIAASAGDPSEKLPALRGAVGRFSFTLAMALAAASVFLVYGSLRLTDAALFQDATFAPLSVIEWIGWGALPSWLSWLRLPSWGALLQPAGFVLFVVSVFAANEAPPFDARGSARFGSFRIGELVQNTLIAALIVTLFLGGWSVPFLSQETLIAGLTPFWGPTVASAICMALHVGSFSAKIVAVTWLQFRVRPSLPELSHERSMQLCFSVVLPLAFVNVFMTAVVMRFIGAAP